MQSLKEQTMSVQGIDVHVVKTTKYKTNTIVLLCKAPLEKETVTKRALLPHVLQAGTENYPTRQRIRNELDELYGASLSVDVQKKGENHIMMFKMEVANEKFLKDTSPLFEKAIALLAQVVLHPKKEHDQFDNTIVENEKRSLKQRIQSVYDDKMRYANLRITEEMCKDEPFGLSVYGNEEAIEPVTAEQLYSYYQEFLHKDKIDLFVVGDVEETQVQNITKQYFSLPEGERAQTPLNDKKQNEIKEKEVLDKQDVKQGKLHLGFRTHTTFGDDDYFALQVCNGLYGGFSHSKLFMNVREKESLAYYAASRYESHKGILMVMSGIEFSNYEKAVSIIKEQMEEMKAGRFSEDEINQTKAMIKNQILETVDVPRALVELLYHNVIANKRRTIEDWLVGIDRVTKEDIQKSAEKIELDTIYFLKGKEEA
ncbi:pitrilysin family protein [Alkalihalobacillus sp. LMS39]|uniref:EF-P 5-aminopentanol modification-associated protein YfmF n=1 Tax=Alkalihalobacillus sp. LMS39 TaxID=2924032 RepID=UPI001FB53E14|nr:pitrilysin family protein [Alkalihalobacillus sp. LMS39]UOE92785.1 insulinase family protein [Alkalihalobacillus sp. LMS39]